MADHELVGRLEQLEQELPLWDRTACLPLLGLLERLRALAWVQIVGNPLEPTDGREPDRLLTIPQVAERLAIPTGHAYELARRDVFPVVRIGKYIRMSQASLTRWIAQQTTPQRRIDTGHGDLHSGTVTAHRQTRIPAKARPEPSTMKQARTRPGRAQTKPHTDQSACTTPTVTVTKSTSELPD